MNIFTYGFGFLDAYLANLAIAAPVLCFLAIIIAILGLITGKLEGLSNFDSLYWAFITALTVGYGDIRPTRKASKALSVLIALVGFVFTGMIVAIAVHSGTVAFEIAV